jgi:TRAP transporter TAXI family solute receptor
MQLLEEGKVDLATVQAATPALPSARMIASLYQDVFQLVVRQGGAASAGGGKAIHSVAELRGRKIALPPGGGGQARSFWFLAEHYGLTPSDVEALPMSASAGNWAIKNRIVDAVFRVRAAGNPSIMELIASQDDLRLVPIEHAAAMRLREPALDRGIIPAGSYQGDPPVPQDDLSTVSVARLLVAAVDLDEGVAATITSVLFERRRELFARTPTAGFITPPNRGAGMFIPLHAGAQTYFDRDQPSFFQENAEPIALIVTVAALMVSGLLQIGSGRKKRRVDQYNRVVLRLGAEVGTLTDRQRISRIKQELFDIAGRVVDDAEVGRISPDGFRLFSFSWEIVRGMVREQEAQVAEKR